MCQYHGCQLISQGEKQNAYFSYSNDIATTYLSFSPSHYFWRQIFCKLVFQSVAKSTRSGIHMSCWGVLSVRNLTFSEPTLPGQCPSPLLSPDAFKVCILDRQVPIYTAGQDGWGDNFEKSAPFWQNSKQHVFYVCVTKKSCLIKNKIWFDDEMMIYFIFVQKVMRSMIIKFCL